MASTDTITGDDTLTLFDRVIADLADGDTSMITYPNDLMTMSTGKNGNSIYAKNETGSNADLVLRLIKGSADDRFLQQKLTQANSDFAGQTLATGELVKRTGDGLGNITRVVTTLRGGMFQRRVDEKENVAGDTEQSVSIYRMKFARASRSIQ